MNDDSIASVPPASARQQEPEAEDRQRWLIWLAALVIATALAVLRSVTTNLGVEALARSDKQGRDYVWRIWWRARHEIVDFGPAWGFTVIYVGLALAFVVLSALAVWVALVPGERAITIGPTDSDQSS